jgi:Asp-tRNA(Asn)/Glu-tRNA(Gln) amidotransferase C subunit
MSQHDIDLKKILWLSRLKATPQEQEKLSSSLIQILDWIGIMKEKDNNNNQKSDWLQKFTLTPEQVQQLIQNKVNRAEAMSQSTIQKEQRSYNDA